MTTAGYYTTIVSSVTYCYPCNTNCLTCSGTATTCTSCPAGQFLSTTSTCGSCNTAANYYTYTSSGVNRCGICSANCATCSGSAATCTSCPSGQALFPDSTCATCSTVGYYTSVVGGVTMCNQCNAVCATCSVSATTCTSCPSGQYLSQTNTCGACDTANGYYTYSSAGVNRCDVCNSNCATCSGTATHCLTCFSGSSLQPDNTCSIACSQGAGYYSYISGGVSVCGPCDSNCLTCSGSATYCQSCNSGQYLREPARTCGTCDMTGAVYQYVEGGIQKCGACDSSCATCSLSPSACTSCPSGTFLHPDSSCRPCDTSAGMYSYTSAGVQKCAACTAPCQMCTTSPTQCLTCDSGFDFSPPSSCVLPAITATDLTLSPSTLSSGCGDGLRTHCFVLTPSLSALTVQELQDVRSALVLTLAVTVTGQSGSQQSTSTTFVLSISTGVIRVEVTLDPLPSEDSYSIALATSAVSTLEYPAKVIRVLKLGQSFPKQAALSQAEVKQVQQQGELVAGLTSFSPVKDRIATEVMGVAAAADPTGTVARFSQVIKIVSRLVYMNVNFGPKLTLFLESSEALSGVAKVSHQEEVQTRLAARGKFSYYRVTTSVLNSFHGWKMVLYCISWVMAFLLSRTVASRPKVGKWVLYLVYYWPKLHLILFNVVFIDLMFHGPRAMLHSNSGQDRFFGGLIIFFSIVDLCEAMMFSFNDDVWITIFRRRTRQEQLEKAVLAGKGEEAKPKEGGDEKAGGKKGVVSVRRSMGKPDDADNKSPGRETASDSQSGGKEKAKEKERVVDFDATYDEIKMNHHQFEMSCNSLMLNREVYLSRTCRLHSAMHYIRIAVYQALLPCTQFCPTITFAALAFIEVFKMARTTYLYFRFKHIKSSLLLMMEFSQGLFLTAFIGIVFSGTSQDMAVMPTLRMQTVSIWLVIISCLLEYILLFSYLVLSAVDFYQQFKRRSELKKKKYQPQSVHSFLRYLNMNNLDTSSPPKYNAARTERTQLPISTTASASKNPTTFTFKRARKISLNHLAPTMKPSIRFANMLDPNEPESPGLPLHPSINKNKKYQKQQSPPRKISKKVTNLVESEGTPLNSKTIQPFTEQKIFHKTVKTFFDRLNKRSTNLYTKTQMSPKR